MVNFGPLTADIRWRVWGTPANFNGFCVLASLLHTDIAQRRSIKLCKMFGRLLGCYSVHFLELLPLMEFCQVQNSVCVQVLRSPILAALLHNTRAAPVSQTLWRDDARNFRRRRHLRLGGHYVGHQPHFSCTCYSSNSNQFCHFVQVTTHCAPLVWNLSKVSMSSSRA